MLIYKWNFRHFCGLQFTIKYRDQIQLNWNVDQYQMEEADNFTQLESNRNA